MITLTFDLNSGTWLNPDGVSGTDWQPSLTYGENQTFSLTVNGLPTGITDAQSWQVAIAKDWQSSTGPMARQTEGVICSIDDDLAVFRFEIDTMIDRFLKVVDGHGEGVSCYMQIVGLDGDRPCCFVTMPIVCRPALDPQGAGTLTPVVVSVLTEAQIEGMIDTAISEAQSVGTTTVITLDGGSGTVEPGKCYSIDMQNDFLLDATAYLSGTYGESVAFVRPNGFDFSVSQAIDLQGDIETDKINRLLLSWTPYGIKAEITATWEV